jgi:hypothetical protein
MRELTSSSRPKETIFLVEEAIFRERRRRREMMVGDYLTALVKHWSSIMSAIFNLIYREFCMARLAEMRKRHLGGQY